MAKNATFLRSAVGAVLVMGCLGATSGTALSAPETLTVGATLSLTGENADNGKHTRRGYELARKLINEKGGIKVGDATYELKIQYYDDESNPILAAKFAKRLIVNDKVKLLLGPYSSATTATVAEVAEKYKIPLVQGNGAALSLFKNGYRYMFGVLSSADQYMTEALNLAAQETREKGGKPSDLKIAIAIENDAFSNDLRMGILNEAKKFGMSVVIDEKLPRDYQDMTFILDKVKTEKPDILIVSGHEGGAELAARQIHEQGVKVPMVAMTHCEGADIHGRYGLYVENTICATQWSPDMTYEDLWFGNAYAYSKRFEAQYGYIPPYQAAESSAAVLVLVDALQRAGSLDGEKVRDALAKTDIQTFFGWVKFDETGRNIAKPMILRQIRQGRYLVVAPSGFAKHKVIYPNP